MLSAYICRQCRIRLSRGIAPVRTPQWQPRATFLSLRTRKPQDNVEEPAPTETQPPAQNQQEAASEVYQTRLKIRYTPVGNEEPQSSRYSRLVRDDIESGIQGANPDGTVHAETADLVTGGSPALGRSYAQRI